MKKEIEFTMDRELPGGKKVKAGDVLPFEAEVADAFVTNGVAKYPVSQAAKKEPKTDKGGDA